jgi:hypothetical protein
MDEYTRRDDKMIDEIREDIKSILSILNGKDGLVSQTEINRLDIEQIKKRPFKAKDWVIAGAIVVTLLLQIGGII